jgi:hypothetical protein
VTITVGCRYENGPYSVETKNTAIMTTVTVVNPTIWRRSGVVPRRQRTISDVRAISQPRLTRVDQKYDSAGLEIVMNWRSLVRVAITNSPAETPSRIFQSLPGSGPSG